MIGRSRAPPLPSPTPVRRDRTFSLQRLDRRTWVLRRTFEAAMPDVFVALTDPAAIRAWYAPRGAAVTACVLELEAGRAWRTEVASRGGAVAVSAGVVEAVEAPHRIVVTDDGGGAGPPVRVTTELASVGQATVLTLTLRFATAAAATAARPLMGSADATYDRLANFLARGGTDAEPADGS